jgi:Heterokaryon incompatibility protein (HET)
MTGVALSEGSQTSANPASSPYQPLDFDTHEIRVLSLLITSENNDRISCSLEAMSLIEPRPYFALSYCWGDAQSTRNILLGDGTARITGNLWLALKAVMKSMASAKTVGTFIRLWVDAVCP